MYAYTHTHITVFIFVSIFSFDLESFMTSLGAIHEIEVINAAGLLPGVRLGYVLCDTCSHASKALQNVEHMLSIHHSPTAVCRNIDFRPRVKIFLGALHSEVAITLSRLLTVYMIPLVSDKYLYLKVYNICILEFLGFRQVKHTFVQRCYLANSS